ncbi:hypothetical protein AMAG_17553 [Allomyces macrogynus ATCC 38327]|uniref:Uncharacterized protein n=1 Tax=Allomyces macrogynus (strain ATCC 38327) TaxID=578462 RepID=A0A0L0TEP5_ALLM3|nr:hypothetical protein AMAG_17553 [Allomyces macrogynus ATCC 38327]|eukprot:KNE73328.1 hypothetical protein AMAG_17553 [Allomyces macrogynus ATCC 38327]
MAPKSPVKLLAGLLGTDKGHRLADKGIARGGESMDSDYVHASTTIASPGSSGKGNDAGTDPGARKCTASPKLKKKPSIFARFASSKHRGRKPSVGGSAPALAAKPDACNNGPHATSVPALTTTGKGRRAAKAALGTSKSTVGSSESMTSATSGSSSGTGTRTSPCKVGSTEARPLVAVVSVDGKLAVLSNVSHAPSPSPAELVQDSRRGTVATSSSSSLAPIAIPPPPPTSNYLEWCAQNNKKRAHPNIEVPEPTAPELALLYTLVLQHFDHHQTPHRAVRPHISVRLLTSAPREWDGG